MKFNTINEIQLNAREYCFTVGKQRRQLASFKVSHPKLMPLIYGKEPKEDTVKFSTKIFANDDKCKITTSGSLKTRNYITMKRSNNCSLMHMHVNSDGLMPIGTKLICAAYDNDPKSLVIIDG